MYWLKYLVLFDYLFIFKGEAYKTNVQLCELGQSPHMQGYLLANLSYYNAFLFRAI